MDLLGISGFSQRLTPFALSYPPNQGSCVNVLLIDNSVKDFQLFSDSANSSTFPIIYSSTSTKTELLALLKANFTTINRFGIVFASKTAIINKFLDCKPFFSNEDSLTYPYSENVEFLISVLKEFDVENIDFLACDTLNYPEWVNYYSILQKETGVQVGASNDKTGNIKHGGDWIMESTSQDIENCYFTQNIEYYTYLLDSGTWTLSTNTVPNNVSYTTSVVNNNFVYVMGGFIGDYLNTVYYAQLNNDGSTGIWNTTNSLPRHMFGMASIVNNNYVYIFGGFDGNFLNTVYYAHINSDGSIGSWIESTSTLPTVNVFEVALVNNNYVYVIGGYTNPYRSLDTVYYAQIYNDGSIGSWISTTSIPNYIHAHTSVVNNSYVYVIGGVRYINGLTNLNTVFYAKLNVDGSVGEWITSTNFPIYINAATSVVNNNYIYVIGGSSDNGNLDTVFYAKLNVDGSIGTWSLSSISPFPFAVAASTSVVNNNYIYNIGGVNTNNNFFNTVYYVASPFPTTSPPNICFPAGTPIETDQGKIPIDQIIPNRHTINKKRIIHVTKTTSTDKYLVEIKKNALGMNYPTQNTLISYGHKLLFNGEMCRAKTFLYKYNNVAKVKNDGEFMYNVLMEDYSTMRVNNLLCETLHPENPVAVMYNKGI